MGGKPVTAVVAVAQNGVMGRNNDLPWRIPTDMKHFKATTMGGALIMGRKTFESFGAKPLPNRLNLVVSSRLQKLEGAEFFRSVEEALAYAESQPIQSIYIIGGARLFIEGLKYCQTVLLTRVLAKVEGDTFFPDLSPDEWSLQEIVPMERGPKDEYPCRLERYQRLAS